jgi:hypothetical protein
MKKIILAILFIFPSLTSAAPFVKDSFIATDISATSVFQGGLSVGNLSATNIFNIVGTGLNILTANSNGASTISVKAGNTISGNDDGGELIFISGNGFGSGGGGNSDFLAGIGGDTGQGGSITMQAGDGGSSSGEGGGANLVGGSAQGGNSNGGNVTLDPGAGIGTGRDGKIIFTRNASTTVLSANYASSTLYYGAGLQTCDSTTGKLTWVLGVFSCGTDFNTSSGGGFAFP